MQISPWTPVPEYGEGIPDVFSGEPSANREEYVNGFFSGLGRIMKLADEAGFFDQVAVLQRERELPLSGTLEDIFAVGTRTPQPRPEQVQAIVDKTARLLEILDIDRSHITGHLPREGTLIIRSDGRTEYAY